jgi:hypothetical protein
MKNAKKRQRLNKEELMSAKEAFRRGREREEKELRTSISLRHPSISGSILGRSMIR